MEAAQLSPHDGERPDDPETLEAGITEPIGGNATEYHDGGSQRCEVDQGPYDPSRLESTGRRDSRLWNDETPRAGHDEGSRSLGAGYDEGSGATRSEGPENSRTRYGQRYGDAGAQSNEGPGTWNDETTNRPGCSEGSSPASREGPGTWNDEATNRPGYGNSEGTGPRNDEATNRPGYGDSEGTGPRNDEATGSPRYGDSEGTGPRNDEVTFTPRPADSEGTGPRNDESTGSGYSKGTIPTASEGSRDPGTISIHSEEHDGPCATPHDARGSPDQRLTGSYGPEGTYAPRSGDEGPNVFSPEKSWDARSKDTAEFSKGRSGSRGSTLESSSEGAESFKKPIAPFRSSWNEKTLDQYNKSSSSPPQPSPPISSRETAPDLSSRLPSDAYRASPAIPYREPAWSGLPQVLYSLEELKGGSILSTRSLSGASWTVFGRLPTCHVSLEHPSVSRYHAVLQYRSAPGSEPDQDPGFYVYDLGSTHGTFINKQRIQPKTYCRYRVGHVLKFGGSTRLFILQGPDEDQEAESELTVTQIKEARRQKESLQKRMLGDDSDEEDDLEEEGEEKQSKEQGASAVTGCMWGMGEDAVEEENDVNPIAVEYQAEQEASYSGNPKKALQGFFDREGEELDFEYEEQGIGTWLCRVKLPADDSSGKQLVAEVVHSGKKKDSMRLCCMEACRMLDMRGLLRQEAVSRKRKAKQWEAEDFYDSDDDTFLDRTGIVEKKRLNRMKKAGRIEEKPETYESLTAKLELVEKEIVEIAAKLKSHQPGEAQTSAQDSLDAFMTEIKSGASLDSVTRKKLHVQSLELKKEQQRLKSLIKIVQPTRLPDLRPNSSAQDSKSKKLTLPMFGAMKGGSKFKLKTGTVGRLPPKRTDLPSSLFTMKSDNNEPEEEEDDDEDDMDTSSDSRAGSKAVPGESVERSKSPNPGNSTRPTQGNVADVEEKILTEEPKKKTEVPSSNRGPPNSHSPPAAQTKEEEKTGPKTTAERQKKMLGPSRPPQGALSSTYPEDDPDYCVWTPPTGQTGDGRTHLNEKYGY